MGHAPPGVPVRRRQIFVHGTGVFTGVVIDTSTDEFATSGETADTAMRPVGIYQALLGLFDGKEVRCHELVRYRPITTEGWFDQLLANAWHPTRMYRVLAGQGRRPHPALDPATDVGADRPAR